jgi:hypothetical protein
MREEMREISQKLRTGSPPKGGPALLGSVKALQATDSDGAMCRLQTSLIFKLFFRIFDRLAFQFSVTP